MRPPRDLAPPDQAVIPTFGCVFRPQPGEQIVGVTTFQGELVVATNERIYRSENGEDFRIWQIVVEAAKFND